MDYQGKLFGKVGRRYFDTGKTSEDWDELKKQADEAKILRVIAKTELILRKLNNDLNQCVKKKDFESAIIKRDKSKELSELLAKTYNEWNNNYSINELEECISEIYKKYEE